MINLDNRLSAVAEAALKGKTPLSVCDVGTDHGFVCVYLVQSGVKKAIATDISAPSAEKARVSAKKAGLSAFVDVRVGNGLETICDGEAETVIIAGMGGLMIMQIMANAPKGVKRYVLQPMRSDCELRRWLCENGFIITDETLAKEAGKLYTIITAEYGASEEYTDAEFYIGKRIIEGTSPLSQEYFKKKLGSLNKKLDGFAVSGQKPDGSLIECKKTLENLIEGGGFDVQG